METFASSVFALGINRQHLFVRKRLANFQFVASRKQMGGYLDATDTYLWLFLAIVANGSKRRESGKYTKPIQFGTKCEYFGGSGPLCGPICKHGPIRE